MIKFYQDRCLLVAFLLLTTFLNAQPLTGTKTIGGTGPTYATLSAAIADLNANGAGAGGVVFNIAAGHTETFSSPTAGTITTVTGTAASPIVFQKSGSGSNPLITAGVGTSTTLDGIIKIVGTDYVTFNGIDLADAAGNTTTTTQMEWGYAILKPSGADGAQRINILNCNISLQKTNVNTKGIYIANHTTISTTSLTVSTLAGTNSYINVSGNNITNSFSGIYQSGYTNVNYYDDSIQIGTNGRNTITNFGGSSTAYGIYAHYFKNVSICNDSIYNNVTPTASSTYYGIYTGPATNANARIVNNGIQIIINGTQSTRAAYGINCNNGIAGNTVVVDSNRIQNFLMTASSTVLPSIYVGSLADTYISNNLISGNVRTGTSGKCWYIFCDQAAVTKNIYGNTIQSNDITGTSSQASGIRIEAGGGNIYQNRILSNTGSGTSAECWNIYANGIVNIYNNLIAGNSGAGSSNEYCNIYTIGGNANIYRNDIYGSSTAANTMIGIELAGTTGEVYNVYQNKLHTFSSTSNSCVVSGIRQSDQSTANIHNNLIGLLASGPTTTTTNGINGINVTSTVASAVCNIYHNNIYLAATTTGGTNCILLSTTPQVTVSNNLLINNSAVGSSATRAACTIKRTSTTVGTYLPASDNNLFYVGATPTLYRYVYYDGTNAFQTLPLYQAYSAQADQNSLYYVTNFVSTSGLSTDFLKPADTSYAESAGKFIAGITRDYLSDISRSTYPQTGQVNGGGSAPDIGAHELDLIFVDRKGPSIGFNGFTKSLVSFSKNLDSVIITDPSGINVTFGTAPRLYFKKSTDANALAATNSSASNGWKYVQSFNSSAPYSFAIDYSLLYSTGSVSGGDVIQYFIVAQDLAATPNVGVKGATLAAVASSVVLTAAQFPVTIGNSYNVLASGMPAAITVGASGADYTSLTQSTGLFAAINAGIVTNDVVVSITSDLGIENGAVTLAKFSEEGVGAGTYKIIIKPQSPITYHITGSATTAGLIRMQDVSRVEFDGSFFGTGRYLNFANKAMSGTITVFHLAGTTAGGGCDHISIHDCNISTDTSTYSLNNNCIFIGGTSVGTGTTAAVQGYNNRYITIASNWLSRAYNGILVNGGTTTQADSIFIRNNEIGSDSAQRYIGTYGIYAKGLKRSVISGNNIHHIINGLNNDLVGIYLDQDVSLVDIAGNRISNIIHTAPASIAALGIYSRAATNNNLIIRSNVITKILGQGSSATIGTGPVGIYFNNGDNSRIVNNTVTLSGNRLDHTVGGAYTACLYVKNALANINVSNNIFRNTMTSSNAIGPGSNFAFYTNSSNTSSFSRFDNNLYLVASATPSMATALAYWGASPRTTLAAWRSATGLDQHSMWGESGYVSDSVATPNLSDTSLWNINGRGYPFAEVPNDINGVSRSTTIAGGANDIGAYEVTPSVPPRSAVASAAPAAATTTYYTVAGDTVASVLWNTGSAVPTDIAVKYYSGVNPPATGSPYYMNAYWDMAATPSTGLNYDITLFYKPEALRTITSESSLVMAKRDGTAPWLPFTSGMTVVNTVTDRMTVAGLTSFSQFTGTDAANPLPVEMLSFNGRATGNDVVLTWSTASQVSFDRFEVQRSFDGKRFEEAGLVRGAQNSQSLLTYRFTDSRVFEKQKRIVYRLKMVDRDGGFSYSQVIAIDGANDKHHALVVYPNPFNDMLYVESATEGETIYTVRDIAGRVVYSQIVSGPGTKALNLGYLEAGVYLLSAGDSAIAKKIVRSTRD